MPNENLFYVTVPTLPSLFNEEGLGGDEKKEIPEKSI